MQTYLVITQTFVDQQNLIERLTASFLASKNFRNSWKKDLQAELGTSINLKNLIDTQQVIIPNLESKEDFRTQINTFYRTWPSPTLLFLGDISTYSQELQEGMLKLLEEPPSNLNIFIFAQNTQNILLTILSRSTKLILPKDYVLANLDQSMCQNLKDKILPASEFTKQLISGKSIETDEKLLEREEIDFYLWQVATNLDYIFTKDKDSQQATIANFIQKVAAARLLNAQNLQKKFVIKSLFLRP